MSLSNNVETNAGRRRKRLRHSGLRQVGQALSLPPQKSNGLARANARGRGHTKAETCGP